MTACRQTALARFDPANPNTKRFGPRLRRFLAGLPGFFGGPIQSPGQGLGSRSDLPPESLERITVGFLACLQRPGEFDDLGGG